METTNYLAIPSEAEATVRYKCFAKFLTESYLKNALLANPTLYLDVLEQFWGSAIVEEIALESGESTVEIHCKVGGKEMTITSKDINMALGIVGEDSLGWQVKQKWWTSLT